MAKPFTWSYSTLSTFEQCPKKYWLMNVTKEVKDEDSEAQADGKFIHDALYKRVIKSVPLPMELTPLEKMAKKFADAKGEKKGEMRLALNRNFEPVDFFAHDVWVRSIVDLLIVRDKTAIVTDYKTGKVKDDFTQLGLTCAVLASWLPDMDLFIGMFAWTKAGKVTTDTYSRSALKGVWNDLLPRVNKMEAAYNDTTMPAKPSVLCGWCPVTSCAHWRPRD